ncbi:A/G-specific adenine glycosylase [Moraxella macacae 0408225]|uniref:Adenine DNA glycosylase n=1 Tax=Moraxella macacae 0408225 TaxID=1230338 RepID=L2F856_9GAMM|nr:A/G-specific adenine glycosylase [Moraxella macacae]ELA09222.1 A/G-specific adenine glycosylase [Moraxella macacae 0408225]
MSKIAHFNHDFTQQLAYAKNSNFADRMLAWFHKYGRCDLPWQQHKLTTPNPYPVWISEVMLQQTQVATVIPYFYRFIHSFPTVFALADADWEQIADHWAGLGYYARARNLHKGAKQLTHIIETTGDFPKTVNDWQTISGVGQSTAGAIVAMGVRDFGVICDGNVKRVLTRWAGIDSDINKSATTQKLWQLASLLTPKQNSGLYAQAIMDLGATLCTKARPNCAFCPIQDDCIANQQGKQTAYPVKSKKSPKPSKYSLVLQLTDSKQQTLWLQRPNSGIWSGLYCLPLAFIKKQQAHKTITTWQNLADCQDKHLPNEYLPIEQLIVNFLQQQHLLNLTQADSLFTLQPKPIKHSLTHFHWHLLPIIIDLSDKQKQDLLTQIQSANLNTNTIWLTPNASKTLAMPTAMQKILPN